MEVDVFGDILLPLSPVTMANAVDDSDVQMAIGSPLVREHAAVRATVPVYAAKSQCEGCHQWCLFCFNGKEFSDCTFIEPCTRCTVCDRPCIYCNSYSKRVAPGPSSMPPPPPRAPSVLRQGPRWPRTPPRNSTAAAVRLKENAKSPVADIPVPPHPMHSPVSPPPSPPLAPAPAPVDPPVAVPPPPLPKADIKLKVPDSPNVKARIVEKEAAPIHMETFDNVTFVVTEVLYKQRQTATPRRPDQGPSQPPRYMAFPFDDSPTVTHNGVQYNQMVYIPPEVAALFPHTRRVYECAVPPPRSSKRLRFTGAVENVSFKPHLSSR